MSTDPSTAVAVTSSATQSSEPQNSGAAAEQWEEVGVTGRTTAATTTTTTSTTTTDQPPVRDLSQGVGSGSGGIATDNIAEKLRIEETKAQLAAARQGMERQAQKLAEEKEKAAAAAAEKTAATGGRWVAPHLRAGASRFSGVTGFGGASTKVDTSSEELFPDLQKAEKIIEQKAAAAQSTVRVPKKTPVGGGASWATKTKKVATQKKAAAAPAPKKEEKKEAPPTPKEEEAKPEPPKEAAPAPAPVPVIQPKITRKAGTKKKKKDLSTFKPGAAS